MLLIIVEMQIKTTMKFHLILFRMAISKKTRNDIFVTIWRKRDHLFVHHWWCCTLGQPLKNGMKFLQTHKKIKNRTTI